MGAPRSPYRRSDWYNALRVDRENILSERNEERHAMLRNKMAAGVFEPIPSLECDADTVPSMLARKIPPLNRA
jgi:hypothetical protein